MDFVRLGSPNHIRGRAGSVPRAMVVHTTEATLASEIATYTDPGSKVSPHYLVGLNGAVVQFVDEGDTAPHAGRVYQPTWKLIGTGSPNLDTIGIEFEDGGDSGGVVRTAEQYRSGARLLRGIAERWGIPLDREHVVGHREIYARKTCPGNLDINRLLEEARFEASFDPPRTTVASLGAAAGDLLVACEGEDGTPVTGLAQDWGSVSPGDLFFCVDRTVTPSQLAGQAVALGAVAVCEDRPSDVTCPRLLVKDGRRAMARVSAAFYGHPADDLTLVAVTGSNGKTTTTYLLEAILRAAGKKTGLVGSVSALIDGHGVQSPGTTPEPPFLHWLLAAMRSAEVDTVVVEVSSQALATHRVDGLRFAAAAFTNLTPDHLDFHGGLDRYFRAKRSLFTRGRVQRAAINADDDYGRILLETVRVPCLSFGRGRADVRALDVRLEPGGTTFRLATPLGTATIRTSLVGSFNVYNCLAAATTALQAGIDLPTIEAGLSTVRLVPGRFQRIDQGQPFAMVVDFARTPVELEQALRAARLLSGPGGRVTCVFGCPGSSDPAQRPLMGAVAAREADRIVVTLDSPGDEDPQSIFEEILAGVPARGGAVYRVVADRRRAIFGAVQDARAGDTVVIAGRGIEPYLNILGRSIRFDDTQVATAALRAQAWPKAT